MIKLSLLGATGSIGSQTLDLVRAAPQAYQVYSLAAAGHDLKKLCSIIEEFKPLRVVVKDQLIVDQLAGNLKHLPEILSGSDGLQQIASDSQIDTVVMGVTGAVGLEPSFAALKAGKRLLIANKETLVAAGELIQPFQQQIIPADSEHVALHQCLRNHQQDKVRTIYLTASGGPFRNSSFDLSKVSPQDALKHPTWQMGPKITIDCASLMNKGLEVIEAHVLFGIPYERIEVLIHPQSLIHSLVEFIDGHILAQLGPNDMRLTLQYALDYPHRRTNLSNCFLNLCKNSKLEFEPPDLMRFPCLKLAYQAGKAGQTYPAVLAAADEEAVNLFLAGRIKFTQIPELVEETLNNHQAQKLSDLQIIKEVDAWTREKIYQLIV